MPRKAVDFDIACSIGSKLPDVKATTGGRGMALKVDGRLMACRAVHKSAEPDTLMVRIGPRSRDALLARSPGTFYVTDHYVSYPAVLVRLPRISRTALRELLAESWEYTRGG